MTKLVLTLVILIFTIHTNAQSIFGKWKNISEETGEVDSVIEVYEKEGKAYAKIIAIMNPNDRNNVCEKCDGDNKNKPILGMNILTGLQKDGDKWSGGKILDPQNGKIYSCLIELEGENKLKIRGYLGASLFGRTIYWKR